MHSASDTIQCLDPAVAERERERERASATTQHSGEAIDETTGKYLHRPGCKVETLSPTGRHVNDVQTGRRQRSFRERMKGRSICKAVRLQF